MTGPLTPRERHELEAMLMTFPPEGPPVGRREQARVLLRSFRPPSPPRSFLIYGQGRTGSTLLGELIGSHPDVDFGDEVLKGRVRAPLQYLEGLRREAAPRSYGVHVKPAHLAVSQGVADRGRWLRAAARRGWLVIHLKRENVLRHVLSNATMHASGASHFRGEGGKHVGAVTVDVPLLLRHMEGRALSARQEEQELEGIDHLTVTYERDLLAGEERWAAVSAQVYEALGREPYVPTTSLRRINKGALPELIANYDEVAAAVSGTQWAALLDS